MLKLVLAKNSSFESCFTPNSDVSVEAGQLHPVQLLATLLSSFLGNSLGSIQRSDYFQPEKEMMVKR